MSNDTIRIWRSSSSAFGSFQRKADPWREETVTALDAYSDGELKRIADSGFNAIWVHGNFNTMVRTAVFPELGADAALHQERLNQLVDRAARHNLAVYVYCQPPRALPADDPFWAHHPQVAGQPEVLADDAGHPLELRSFCTSTAEVKRYLVEAGAELAKRVPGLGGVIMITASEYPSHCWGRRGRIMLGDGSYADAEMECPRCARRRPEEVIAEVVQLVRDGIRQQSERFKIIAWNWSWSFFVPSPCTEIISRLPVDVILMADFERGGRKVILGRERVVDEYSLGFAGPSEQFAKSLAAARECGLAVMAKLQFGTTHELATVPNLPVLGNVFAKATAVRELKLAGFMGCWNFGNMISANTAGFNAFLSGQLPKERDAALQAFAASYFPGGDPAKIAAGWLKFGEAMDHYPFSIPMLYSGPVNFAFVLPTEPGPLTGKPVGRSWLLDERGDDLAPALVDYTADEAVTGFSELAAIWREGLKLYGPALGKSDHARSEWNTALVCYHAFRSAANFCRIYRLRLDWSEARLPEFRAIAADEAANLEAVLPILESDPRFGYHIEAHGYQYDPAAVRARLEKLKLIAR